MLFIFKKGLKVLADVLFDSIQFRVKLNNEEKTQVKAFIKKAIVELAKYRKEVFNFSLDKPRLYLEISEGEEYNKPVMTVTIGNDDNSIRSYTVFTVLNEKFAARCRIEEGIERYNHG